MTICVGCFCCVPGSLATVNVYHDQAFQDMITTTFLILDVAWFADEQQLNNRTVSVLYEKESLHVGQRDCSVFR